MYGAQDKHPNTFSVHHHSLKIDNQSIVTSGTQSHKEI